MLRLRSASFEDGGEIPRRCASQQVPGAANLSPALEWDGAPEGTASFGILMIDRHPTAHGFVHWLVADIPGDTPGLPEGASAGGMPQGAVQLLATPRTHGYHGPTPPRGSGVHRYEVSVYALSERTLDLHADSTIDEFTDAIEGNVVDVATIVGTFEQ